MHVISIINIASLEGTFRINYKDEGGVKRRSNSADNEEEKDTNPDDYETTTEWGNTGMDDEEEEGEKDTNPMD